MTSDDGPHQIDQEEPIAALDGNSDGIAEDGDGDPEERAAIIEFDGDRE